MFEMLCRENLPKVQSIDRLVAAEPRLLRADAASLLAEVKRLLPDRDGQEFLAQDPSVRSAVLRQYVSQAFTPADLVMRSRIALVMIKTMG